MHGFSKFSPQSVSEFVDVLMSTDEQLRVANMLSVIPKDVPFICLHSDPSASCTSKQLPTIFKEHCFPELLGVVYCHVFLFSPVTGMAFGYLWS